MNNITGSSGNIFNIANNILIFVGSLIATHIALQLAGSDWLVWSRYVFAFDPARYGPEPILTPPGAQFFNFVTYAFLHGSWEHLFFNCLWLIVFGAIVARRFDSWRLIVLSLFCAISAAFASLLVHWGEDIIVIGASGIVSGYLAASLPVIYAPAMQWYAAYNQDLSGIRVLTLRQLVKNRNAMIFVAIWLSITLFSGATSWTGIGFLSAQKIAWEAHIAGFFAGIFGFYLLDQKRDRLVSSP